MDFHRYRALTGSRLKFWTVPQGLKIHRTLTVLWNPELLLEAVWTVALWTQDPHRASSAKLGDAMQGLFRARMGRGAFAACSRCVRS